MTVGTKVKQTIASLKGAQATLEIFVAIEETPETKAILNRNSQRIAQVIKDMEKRLSVLEFEEPQYKGF